MSHIRFSLDPQWTRRLAAGVDEWLGSDRLSRLWMGDSTIWSGSDEGRWLGWLDIANQQLDRIDEIEAFVESVEGEHLSAVVVLGMGGSSLCVEVLANILPTVDGPRLLTLDSTDPEQVIAVADSLDLSTTLFVEASKSGSTLEPTILAAYMRHRVAEVVGPYEVGRRFLAITDPGSELEQTAARLDYLATFHGLPSIGGRYSALSDFGIVPAALSGIDVRGLLRNAQAMAAAGRVSDRDNPALTLGVLIGLGALHGRDKVTIVGTAAVGPLGAWLEQLLAESTGKQGNGVVPVDREPLGPVEVYGTDRIFVHLSHRGEQDTMAAKLDALAQAGHPVVHITFDELLDLGGEFFRWELATAIAGSVIGINPFDQPDVEDAKVETRKLTERYESTGELPELAWTASSPRWRVTTSGEDDATVEELVLAHLDQAGANDYVALLAYLPMTSEIEGMLTQIRVLIRDRHMVATCVGFGPRFQHSTGQVYKGGPNTGVFLQLTCRDSRDAQIPEHGYTFGVVKECQARGDFVALADRGRRVLRLDLNADPMTGLSALKDLLASSVAG